VHYSPLSAIISADRTDNSFLSLTVPRPSRTVNKQTTHYYSWH